MTGPGSFDLFSSSDVPTDAQGFLLVNDALQSVNHSEIFGAGDCVTLERYPTLPKNGVYTVRQGPILWKNLKNRLSSEKLISFVPQKRVTSILSTGDGDAFMMNGGMTLHGRIPMKIKQHIDRKFMKRYKNLYD